MYGERRFTGCGLTLLGVQRIGRYEILSHLASGGMGQVYLARSTGLGGFERQVVVKTLDLSITDDDEAFVTMFLDEARLVGALHHQYIAPVYEVGCDEEGRYYLVMDYVHGETAELVYRASAERAWPVPWAFALTVVSSVASALDYAHNLCAADGTPLDIVHRDISLSNVMVGYDGGVKLIDFGIAKAANRATKTQVGTLKGKIGYLAPEQILRKNVDHRADIFSLGIVLYELTTATRAFRDSSDLVTLERITSGDVKAPSSFTPNYPPELERIVMKALQVDPDQRYQDAAQLGRELERLAAQMNLPLGHAAIASSMKHLFGDMRRGRRRFARGSDVKTDPSIQIIEDDEEKTPVVDVSSIQPDPQARARAARPTTPIAKRSGHESIDADADDLPTPVSGERALPVGPSLRPTPPGDRRLITPLPDLSRSTAQVAAMSGAEMAVPTTRRATPTQRMPSPPFGERQALPLPASNAPPPRVAQHTPTGQHAVPAVRLPTGPQLPVVVFHAQGSEIAELPTHITGMRTDHEATDFPVPPRPPPPPLSAAHAPLVRARWAPSTFTHAVVARVKPVASKATRTWFILCGLFVLAVATAIAIAML
ncbi:MAG TPA: protein kinase [Kofleriaceae bacterium]|nr:protein kinase [Kofleriaceae bacterium]